MHQSGTEQFANQPGRSTGRLKLVHIGRAIRVDPRQQRHHFGQRGEVLPGQLITGGTGNRRQVQAMVGRTAAGQQGHHRIDQRARIDLPTNRQKALTLRTVTRDQACRLVGQCITQWRIGMNEGAARHMQAHGLHQQLVGVGRAVEGTSAGLVIGGQFGGQQLITTDLAAYVALAHGRFVPVGQPGVHRPSRHEYGGQMAELQGADQQARDDLVAHPEIEGAIEDAMGQADGRGLGYQIAGEQRQLHARLALGDAIAHGRHPGGELRGGALLGQSLFKALGIVTQRRMGRKQVVVAGNDGDMRRTALLHD